MFLTLKQKLMETPIGLDKIIKSRAEELYNKLPDDLKKDLEFIVNSSYSSGESNGKRNSRIVTGKIGNWSEFN